MTSCANIFIQTMNVISGGCTKPTSTEFRCQVALTFDIVDYFCCCGMTERDYGNGPDDHGLSSIKMDSLPHSTGNDTTIFRFERRLSPKSVRIQANWLRSMMLVHVLDKMVCSFEIQAFRTESVIHYSANLESIFEDDYCS